MPRKVKRPKKRPRNPRNPPHTFGQWTMPDVEVRSDGLVQSDHEGDRRPEVWEGTADIEPEYEP